MHSRLLEHNQPKLIYTWQIMILIRLRHDGGSETQYKRKTTDITEYEMDKVSSLTDWYIVVGECNYIHDLSLSTMFKNTKLCNEIQSFVKCILI